MGNLNMNVISKHLAANINEQGDIVFCENALMIPSAESNLSDSVIPSTVFTQTTGEITFFNLDPNHNYLQGPYNLDDSDLNPSFECHADKTNMVVTVTWKDRDPKYGFLGRAPLSPDHFPAAGYLALEELKSRITNANDHKKAEDALFEAIGRVIYPGQQKAIKLTRNLYRKDLQRHHEAASFPLKGTSVQSGIRCMINGELHVLTHYGVAKVSYGAYGNLVLDTSFRLNFSEDSCSIDMGVFCNSEASICESFQGASTSPNSSGSFSVYSFPEVFQTLSSYYKDLKLIKHIFTAVLSEACFHNTDLSLQSRWLNASEIMDTVLEDQLDPSSLSNDSIEPRTTDHILKSALSGISDHRPMSLIGIKSRVRFTEFASESDSRLKKWIDGV